MSKFGKAIVAVIVMVMLVMGGTAVFAQNADGGDSPPAAFLQDDGDNVQIAPEDGENGRLEGRPNNGRHGFGNREAQAETVAAILGISVEELEAAHEAGTTLPELVESLGLNMDDVQAAVEAAKAEALASGVADGLITQEQADEIASHEGGRGRPGGQQGNGDGPRGGQEGNGGPDGNGGSGNGTPPE